MDFLSRIFKPRVMYKPHPWTDEELKTDGFRYFYPIKRVSMVRLLPESESPKIIQTPWNNVIAKTGDYIAYVAGDKIKNSLDDYEPRPIEPAIFHETYEPWTDPNWKPTPAEAHLSKLGCKPYYKTAGVWAKRLREKTLVQSLESPAPSITPAGAWLCIGVAGEPWTVSDEWFHWRYIVPERNGSQPAVNH